jgi:hypothetical protein
MPISPSCYPRLLRGESCSFLRAGTFALLRSRSDLSSFSSHNLVHHFESCAKVLLGLYALLPIALCAHYCSGGPIVDLPDIARPPCQSAIHTFDSVCFIVRILLHLSPLRSFKRLPSTGDALMPRTHSSAIRLPSTERP